MDGRSLRLFCAILILWWSSIWEVRLHQYLLYLEFNLMLSANVDSGLSSFGRFFTLSIMNKDATWQRKSAIGIVVALRGKLLVFILPLALLQSWLLFVSDLRIAHILDSSHYGKRQEHTGGVSIEGLRIIGQQTRLLTCGPQGGPRKCPETRELFTISSLIWENSIRSSYFQKKPALTR